MLRVCTTNNAAVLQPACVALYLLTHVFRPHASLPHALPPPFAIPLATPCGTPQLIHQSGPGPPAASTITTRATLPPPPSPPPPPPPAPLPRGPRLRIGIIGGLSMGGQEVLSLRQLQLLSVGETGWRATHGPESLSSTLGENV